LSGLVKRHDDAFLLVPKRQQQCVHASVALAAGFCHRRGKTDLVQRFDPSKQGVPSHQTQRRVGVRGGVVAVVVVFLVLVVVNDGLHRRVNFQDIGFRHAEVDGVRGHEVAPAGKFNGGGVLDRSVKQMGHGGGFGCATRLVMARSSRSMVWCAGGWIGRGAVV